MIQKTFDVHQGKPGKHRLHIEAGRNYLSLTAFDENDNASRNFELYNFDENDDFNGVLSELERNSIFLQQDYKEIKIVWENANAQYVPAKFYNDESKDTYFEIIGKNIEPQEQKSIGNNEFVIAYTTDKNRYDLLHKKFPQAQDSHKFFEVADKLTLSNNDFPLNVLIIFYSNHFIISAYKNYKNGVLQFINSVNFSSEKDVVYYLLNASKQLGVSISETLVTLSGFIDGDSSLFNEINKYVTNIDVDATPKAAFLKDNFSAYPSHFFVPFFKYA